MSLVVSVARFDKQVLRKPAVAVHERYDTREVNPSCGVERGPSARADMVKECFFFYIS